MVMRLLRQISSGTRNDFGITPNGAAGDSKLRSERQKRTKVWVPAYARTTAAAVGCGREVPADDPINEDIDPRFPDFIGTGCEDDPP